MDRINPLLFATHFIVLCTTFSTYELTVGVSFVHYCLSQLFVLDMLFPPVGFRVPAVWQRLSLAVSLTAASVREKQSERLLFLLSRRTFWQISCPYTPRFSPSSSHLCPPAVCDESLWNTVIDWLKSASRRIMSGTCWLTEVSISFTVNTGPPSIARRLQTSHPKPMSQESGSVCFFLLCAALWRLSKVLTDNLGKKSWASAVTFWKC